MNSFFTFNSRYTLKLIALIILCLSDFAAGKDFSIKKSIKYEISRKGGHYVLSSETVITQKYLSPKSLNSTTITIPEAYFAPLDDITCRLNNEKIPSNRIYTDNMQRKDVFIDDNKVHIIKLPENLKVGDEAKVSYEEDFTDIAHFPVNYIPNVNSVDEFKIEIEYPEELSVDFDFFFPHNKLNYKLIRESEKVELRFDSLTYIPEAAYGDFNEILAGIMMVVKKGNEYITPSTSESFMKWYRGLFDDSFFAKTDLRSNLAGEINNDLAPMEKVQKINDFVRENIHYIAYENGINSIVPRAPSLVFERKFGDCKDKAFLVSSIAKEYGIEVYPALVCTENFYGFSHFHAGLFDHVICAYKADSKYVFFDPTSEHLPFAVLGEALAGKSAFIVDSLNPHYELITTDNSAPEIEMEISGNIDSLGNADAKITFHKDLCAFVQDSKDHLKGNDFDNYVSNLVVTYLRNISVDIRDLPGSLSLKNSGNGNSIDIYAKADLSKFVIASAKKTYIPKTPFIILSDKILTREGDSNSLNISGIPFLTLRIKLKADNYSISDDSLYIQSKLKPSKYYSILKAEKNNMLSLCYKFERPFYLIKPSEKNEFIDFCKTYYSNKNQMFILNRKMP